MTPPTSLPGKTPDCAQTYAYPLSEFYAHAKLPLPAIEVVPGEAVPEPFKSLLVHHNDMTPTLETFHRSDIHLEIVSRERRGEFYFRQVVLRLNGSEQPVEFGANKVYLGSFPDEARDLILQEHVPLGRILKECGIQHRTEAKGFLRVMPDTLIREKFDLPQPIALYGRKAVICDRRGRPLSEIVEILPPAKTAPSPG